MAKIRVKLAPNTWTDLSTYFTAVGNAAIVRADGTDFSFGRKAIAPTSGVALTQGQGVMVLVKAGDTLKPWALSVAGGYLEIDKIAAMVITDGTGTV